MGLSKDFFNLPATADTPLGQSEGLQLALDFFTPYAGEDLPIGFDYNGFVVVNSTGYQVAVGNDQQDPSKSPLHTVPPYSMYSMPLEGKLFRFKTVQIGGTTPPKGEHLGIIVMQHAPPPFFAKLSDGLGAWASTVAGNITVGNSITIAGGPTGGLPVVQQGTATIQGTGSGNAVNIQGVAGGASVLIGGPAAGLLVSAPSGGLAVIQQGNITVGNNLSVQGIVGGTGVGVTAPSGGLAVVQQGTVNVQGTGGGNAINIQGVTGGVTVTIGAGAGGLPTTVGNTVLVNALGATGTIGAVGLTASTFPTTAVTGNFAVPTRFQRVVVSCSATAFGSTAGLQPRYQWYLSFKGNPSGKVVTFAQIAIDTLVDASGKSQVTIQPFVIPLDMDAATIFPGDGAFAFQCQFFSNNNGTQASIAYVTMLNI